MSVVLPSTHNPVADPHLPTLGQHRCVCWVTVVIKMEVKRHKRHFGDTRFWKNIKFYFEMTGLVPILFYFNFA